MKKILFFALVIQCNIHTAVAWYYTFKNEMPDAHHPPITIDLSWGSLKKKWNGKHKKRACSQSLDTQIILKPGETRKIDSINCGLNTITFSIPKDVVANGTNKYIAFIDPKRNEVRGTRTLTIDGVYGHAQYTMTQMGHYEYDKKNHATPRDQDWVNFIGVSFKKNDDVAG